MSNQTNAMEYDRTDENTNPEICTGCGDDSGGMYCPRCEAPMCPACVADTVRAHRATCLACIDEE